MAGLPPVPNVLKCQLLMNVDNDVNAENVLHFKYSGGPPSTTDCATLAADVAASWGANLKSLASTNIQLDTVIMTDLASSSGFQGGNNPNTIGTRAGGFIGAGMATLVNHAIVRRYRGGKPRTYLPFGVTTDLNGMSAWAAAYVNAVNAGWAAFIAAIIGASSGTTAITQYVNVSYFSGYTLGPPQPGGFRKKQATVRGGGPVVDTIVGSACNTLPSSQRRRNLHGK